MSHPLPIKSLALIALGGVIICGAISVMAHKAYAELDATRKFSPFVDRMTAMSGVLLLSVIAAAAGFYGADDFPHVGPRLAALACGLGGLMAPALYGGAVAAARKVLAKAVK